MKLVSEPLPGVKILKPFVFEAQKRGIRKLAALDMLIKINIVLIPEINDFHIEEIAKTVKECGANLININVLVVADAIMIFTPSGLTAWMVAKAIMPTSPTIKRRAHVA